MLASGCAGIDEYQSSPSSDTDSKSVSSEDSSYSPEGMAEEAGSGGVGTRSVERKTITTAEMSIEVEDAAFTLERIAEIARDAGGYVSSSSVYALNYDTNARKDGYITVRVPESEYPAFMETVEEFGELSSRSVSAHDVTEEYIDLSARLENLERQETRLADVLNMSVTVEEILSVEKELERVRGEIDSLTGRLEYLDNRIEFSTINIHVTEPRPISQSWGLRDAFSESVQGFISMVNALIILAGYLLPIVIAIMLMGGLFIGIRRVTRR
ncbi:DUF4349 domain-containing protein [Methanolobus halotolerans]|uniref:DUF4349 domain-containing protein n=1 Tax=Methanolobus halotolerans TaxID=2052935 RepID=UPI001436A96E|nr:DUF4349 domain-containing protein [Methanolobus halotolerans]